jgi:hypothetical protein
VSEKYDNESVKFHNLDVVINRIKAIGGGAQKYFEEVLGRCMNDDVWPLWIKHISLQDHSLEDLRKLGHPYSTRFDVDSFMHPDSEVHRQSGSLIEGSHITTVSTTGSCTVQLSNSSPHYVFVRYGSRTMRMRDPAGTVMRLGRPLIEKRIQDEIKGAIVKILVS